MSDSTVFLLIMIYGNLAMLAGIIVGVKSHSFVWGFLAWLFAPLIVLVLFFGLFGGGRTSMPNPQRYENDPYQYHRH
ncbi:hypothetical protein ACT3SZ_14975 [Corynebacterium sp. AOP40-9SA-29]|uniref:hypothetical protein n=1 Tax=Corynebacterium sp. AOP40-9SA-29 TaxID=3457677 RepID=UPI0040341EF2